MASEPILVSASMDKTIRFWDIEKQESRLHLEFKDSQINAMCITPDANQLAIGSWQHVRVYSLQNPTPQGLHTFSVHEQKNVTAVGFEADGRWMYTAGEDGTAKIWDMRVTQLNCQRIFQVKTPVNSVALHPNQSELVVADSTGVLYVWDLRTDVDDSMMTNVDISEYIVHVDIDRMGRQCAAVTNRGNLFIWNINRNQPSISPLATITATQNANDSIRDLYDTNPPESSKNKSQASRLTEEDEEEAAEEEDDEEENDEEYVASMAAYEQRDIAAKNLPSSRMAMGNATSMSPLAPPPAMISETSLHDQGITRQPGFSNPDNHQQRNSTTLPVVTSSQADSVPPISQSQPSTTSSLLRSSDKIRAHSKFGLKCRFRPDSLVLVTTSADQSAKSWSVTNRNLLNTYTVPGCRWVWDCNFTNDSKYMLTSSSDGVIRMWDMDSCDVVCNLRGHSLGITAMAFRDAA